MGMLRGAMAAGVLATLSGCGAYNDFQANNAVQDYRQNCTGNYTNECESKLVDTNIIMLELARSNIDREKDTLLEAVGKDGYERFAKAANEVIDDLIDRQEQKRPGLFARWFLGEGQPFKDTRNQLFLESDMKDLRTAVLKRISAGNTAAPARTPTEEPLTPTAAFLLGKDVQPAPQSVEATAATVAAVQPASAQPSLLEAAVDYEIANEIAKDGGDEFKDARQILLADLNGDGTNDAVVLYTIEGQGGGNGYFQSLATFYARPDGWDYRGKIVVGQGVQNVALLGSQTLALKVLTVGPDDADCCPSVESIQKYTWDGATFVQSPTT